MRSLMNAWSSARGGITVKGFDGAAGAGAGAAAEGRGRDGGAAGSADGRDRDDPFLEAVGVTVNARINWSLRIACHPGIPWSLAICASAFLLQSLRDSTVMRGHSVSTRGRRSGLGSDKGRFVHP